MLHAIHEAAHGLTNGMETADQATIVDGGNGADAAFRGPLEEIYQLPPSCQEIRMWIFAHGHDDVRVRGHRRREMRVRIDLHAHRNMPSDDLPDTTQQIALAVVAPYGGRRPVHGKRDEIDRQRHTQLGEDSLTQQL